MKRKSAAFASKTLTVFLCGVMVTTGQQPPPQKEFTFSSTSNLVIVNVEARDKDGKPLEGLKKEDFVLTEDGKPQQISVFEFQKLGAEATAPLLTAAASITAAPQSRPKPAGITVDTPGHIKYQDRRLLVMLFDFSAMPVEDQIRSQDAALKFLDKQIATSDLVAIMTNTNRLRVEQDFTDNRETLISVIKGFRIGDAAELAAQGEVGDTDNGEDTSAAFVPDETEFNIFSTDLKLSALETAAKMLAPLPEKKALVYFSSGIAQSGTDNLSQLRATINAAVRANVSFYPIDARGLVASAPAGNAGSASQRGSGIFSGKAQSSQRDSFRGQQDTLYTLAADTGGKAFLDNNDLALGIKQAQTDVVSYYILGYYSSNPSADGHFRRVKVEMREIKATLNYRSGYFAPKQWKQFNASDKERQLEEALLLGDPITDLRMAAETDYFRLGKDSYYVPVSVKIPASQISLKKKGSDEITEFDFIGQIRDKTGRLVGNLRDGIKVKLSDADAAQRAHRSFQYNTGFTLPSGEYKLKFLARENQTGKMGTYETSFQVPDLSGTPSGLRLSSVVWSSQREPLSAAVGGAGTKKKIVEADPLVQDGQRLVPSITRSYRRDQNLFIYMEVYDPGVEGDTKTPSLSANLTFFLGDKKAFESPAVKLNQVAKSRKSVLPLQFQVPLAKLVPGKYTCQVNIVDEVGRKFAFARGAITVLPEMAAAAGPPHAPNPTP